MNKRGFTLVELVVGIVVLAIAMMIMNTLLISQSKDALEPLYRLRASQLGQSIMQNILSRAYDENSDHNGGYYRCGEVWQNGNLWFDDNIDDWTTVETPPTIVSCSSSLGIDAEEVQGKHFNFNDVDDFITSGFISANDYGNVVGDKLGGDDYSSQYNNYAVKIEVGLDNNQGITMKKITMKKITLTIQTPSNEQIQFSALKGNY